MKLVIFASSKGGAGKTTLAAAVSVEAAKKHSVAVLDLDPQQSLARWHDTRGAPDVEGEPVLLEASCNLVADVAGQAIAFAGEGVVELLFHHFGEQRLGHQQAVAKA